MADNGQPVRGYDTEYFKGLTAERRIVKSKHGFRTYIWTKRLSQRNEPFDCRNYALAAARLPWCGIDLAKMDRDLYKPPQPEEKASPFGAQKAAMFQEGGAPPTPQPDKNALPSKFGATNRPLE
jgi:phage terminase large subunit GpA-like protein